MISKLLGLLTQVQKGKKNKKEKELKKVKQGKTKEKLSIGYADETADLSEESGVNNGKNENDVKSAKREVRKEKAKLYLLQVSKFIASVFESIIKWLVSYFGGAMTFIILASAAVIVIIMLLLSTVDEDDLKKDDMVKLPNKEGVQAELLWDEDELSRYSTYFNNFELNLFKIAILTNSTVNGYGTSSKFNEVLGVNISDSIFKMAMGVQTTETNWAMYASEAERNTKDVFIDASTVDQSGDIQGPYQMGSSWTFEYAKISDEMKSIIKGKYKNPNGSSERHYYPYATTISLAGTFGKMNEQGLNKSKYTDLFKELAPSFGIVDEYEKFQSEAIVMLMQTAYLSAPNDSERRGICAFICGVWAMSSDNPAQRSFDNYSLNFDNGLDITTKNHQQFFGVSPSGNKFELKTPSLKGNLKNLEFGSIKTILLNGTPLDKPLVAEVVSKYWDKPGIQEYNNSVISYSSKGNQFVLKGIYGIESFLVGKQILEYLSSKVPLVQGGVSGEGFTQSVAGTIQGPWQNKDLIAYLEKSKNKKYYGQAYALENKDVQMYDGNTFEDWRLSSKWKVPYYRQSSQAVESKVGYGRMTLSSDGCHVYMNAYIASALTGTLINPTEMMDAMVYTKSLQTNGYYNNTYKDVDNVFDALGIHYIRGDMGSNVFSGDDKDKFEALLGSFSGVNSKDKWKEKVDLLLEKDGLIGLSMGPIKASGGVQFTSGTNHYIVLTEKVGDKYKTMGYGTGSSIGGYKRDFLTFTWDEIYKISVGGAYRGQIYFAYNPNVGGVMSNLSSIGKLTFAGVSETEKNQLLFGRPTKPKTSSDIRESEISSKIETITVKMWVGTSVNKRSQDVKITVHKELVTNVKAIFDEIYKHPSKPVMNYGGGYNYRVVNNGTGSNTLSNHSFGAAFDFNVPQNPFPGVVGNIADYKPKTDPLSFSDSHVVVQIFRKYGWRWGGEYKDYMHFELFGG